MFERVHRQITKVAIRLGPHNPAAQFFLKRTCRKYGCELVDRGQVLELRKGARTMRLSQAHFIYVPNIAQRFETFFDPVIPDHLNDEEVVDYSRPRLHTHRISGLQFELAAFPEEDEAIEGYFRWYRPRPGDRVFDIGANCGVSTYYFSKLVGPNGRVIAFEPDTLNRSLLLRNMERHQLGNVTVVDAAVAATTGQASFHEEGTLGSCLSRCSPRGTTGTLNRVKTVSLADAFSLWGRPDLCKIDIEGAEIEVIEAAAELLTVRRTHFTIDTSHVINGRMTAQRIEKSLRAYGFDVESVPVAGMMTTWARPFPKPEQETAQYAKPAAELEREHDSAFT